MKQEMMGLQWRQLDHMQIICTSLRQISTPAPHYWIFFTGLMLFLTPNQWCQSTEGWAVITHTLILLPSVLLRLLMVIAEDVQPVMHVTEAIFLGSLEDLCEGH